MPDPEKSLSNPTKFHYFRLYQPLPGILSGINPKERNEKDISDFNISDVSVFSFL
jgi:hypothetical protein